MYTIHIYIYSLYMNYSYTLVLYIYIYIHIVYTQTYRLFGCLSACGERRGHEPRARATRSRRAHLAGASACPRQRSYGHLTIISSRYNFIILDWNKPFDHDFKCWTIVLKLLAAGVCDAAWNGVMYTFIPYMSHVVMWSSCTPEFPDTPSLPF